MTTPKTVLRDVLGTARALITSPDNWTQGVLYAGKNNEPYIADSSERCKFCAMGAVYQAADILATPEVDAGVDSIAVLESLTPEPQSGDGRLALHRVAAFNDSHTHAEVLEFFDNAIRSLEQ